MICSRCRIPFLNDPNCTLVCPCCGITKKVLVPEYDYFKQPLFLCSYSRAKRFEGMLSRVLLPCFESKDTEMFIFLSKNKPYETVTDIMEVMKTSRLKDKRYCSLHLFARHFLSGYRAPQHDLQYHKQVLQSFQDVERNFFRKHHKAPFFNYPWLLRTLLQKHKLSGYACFVKPIRCGKRNLHYEALYATLTNAHINEASPDNPETNHGTTSERGCGHGRTPSPKNELSPGLLNNLLDDGHKMTRIDCRRFRCGAGSPWVRPLFSVTTRACFLQMRQAA